MLFQYVIILLVTVHGLVDAKNVTRGEVRRVTNDKPVKNLKEVTFDDNDDRSSGPKDCAAIYLNQRGEDSRARSGVYRIYPKGVDSFEVYCDMDTDGGGWTLIQRRGPFSPRENFYRGWKDYKEGFGDGRREFWLGNDNITILTNQDSYNLRFDLEDAEGLRRFAEYSEFRVDDESENYRMRVESFLKGDAGDSFSGQSGMQFTTKDQDHDQSTRYGNCAQTFRGAWWYKDCHFSNLNGERNSNKYGEGINWHSWHGYNYSLKRTEMKIRPSSFTSRD